MREQAYNPVVGGKAFSDGRVINVRCVPCWDGEKMDIPQTLPSSWATMSDVERAICALETSSKPAVQVYSMLAEWVEANGPSI